MENDLCFFSTLSTAFLLITGMFLYPNQNTSFLLFLILLRLSTFKAQNALYLKFERLKILGRTCVLLKLGVPGWGISLNRVLKILEVLNHYNWMDEIFGAGRY